MNSGQAPPTWKSSSLSNPTMAKGAGRPQAHPVVFSSSCWGCRTSSTYLKGLGRSDRNDREASHDCHRCMYAFWRVLLRRSRLDSTENMRVLLTHFIQPSWVRVYLETFEEGSSA